MDLICMSEVKEMPQKSRLHSLEHSGMFNWMTGCGRIIEWRHLL